MSREFLQSLLACGPCQIASCLDGAIDPDVFLEALHALKPYILKLPTAQAARSLRKLANCAFLEQELIYDLLVEIYKQQDEQLRFSYHFLSKDWTSRPIVLRTDSQDGHNVLVKEGSTGFRIWEAAKYFLSFLLKNPEIVKDKRILEIGAGTGFVSIGLNVSGLCQDIVISDVHAKVLTHISDSVRESACGENVCVQALDWENFDATDFADRQVVIAADVIYDPTLVEPLVRALKRLVHGNCVALLCSAIRNEQTAQLFLHKAQEIGLVCTNLAGGETESILDRTVVLDSLIYGNEIDSTVALYHISS